MTSDDNEHSPGMDFANELINIANSSLENGTLTEGMRHAAANFSAYAFFRTGSGPQDPNTVVENFLSFFDYYLGIHEPKDQPGMGLSQTIAQAKDEL
jgi:hypothetical protein